MKHTISVDVMKDPQTPSVFDLTPGALRKMVADAWMVVTWEDQHHDEMWCMWHGTDAAFWNGAEWRPISEFRSWLDAGRPASRPTTA